MFKLSFNDSSGFCAIVLALFVGSVCFKWDSGIDLQIVVPEQGCLEFHGWGGTSGLFLERLRS